MKTIKTILLLLLSTLFLSCSETYDDDVFFEPTVERITYHHKQYYEDPIVIDKFTSEDELIGYSYRFDWSGGHIGLGYLAYQQVYINNEVIDTLTIDLNSYNREIKTLSFNSVRPSSIENKYIAINYLNIIGLDNHPNLQIIGNCEYGWVDIYGSNVSIEKLKSISVRSNGYCNSLFKKVDHERKEWSRSTYVLDSKNYKEQTGRGTGNPIKGYIGFIGYDVSASINDEYKGLKLEIVDITEHYD